MNESMDLLAIDHQEDSDWQTIAFSKSSSSFWLNHLSYLFDHTFVLISFLSFLNLDVVHNVRHK
jgi:hypothetical protein